MTRRQQDMIWEALAKAGATPEGAVRALKVGLGRVVSLAVASEALAAAKGRNDLKTVHFDSDGRRCLPDAGARSNWGRCRIW